jgi:hypothetical protein
MPIGNPLTAVWEFDDSGSAYVNNTLEAQIEGGTAFELLGQATDFTYFGFSRRFDALMFVLAVTGSVGGVVWAYGASATSWIQFAPTRAYNLDSTPSYMLWDHRRSAVDTAWAAFAFDGTDPHPFAPPDTVSRFWIRVSATTVTTPVTVASVVCRPYTTYATVEDVQRQLQLRVAFSTTTTPTLSTVEDYLRGAEDYLVYQMGRSWRVDFVEDELVNFNQYGMKLRREDIIELYELAVYDGSNFDAKITGRGDDYHFEELTGMIYVSTIFLDAMPPNFRRSYTKRREQGAFKRAVRVNYSWGKDISKHFLGVQVQRIATYKACMDIVTNMDFSPLIPLGMDTVNLQQKVDNWTRDVQDFVEAHAKLRMA